MWDYIQLFLPLTAQDFTKTTLLCRATDETVLQGLQTIMVQISCNVLFFLLCITNIYIAILKMRASRKSPFNVLRFLLNYISAAWLICNSSLCTRAHYLVKNVPVVLSNHVLDLIELAF